MEKIYETAVTATGGRNGQIKSEDGILNIETRMPKALGGANDNYVNPEMLFAGGYAACFDSALNMVIKQAKVSAGETSVKATVGIVSNETGGFGLTAELHANIPGVSLEQAQELIEKAHEICPYSNATRGNIDVKLSVSND